MSEPGINVETRLRSKPHEETETMNDIHTTPVPFGLMRFDKAANENDAIDLVRRAINQQWFRRRRGVARYPDVEFLRLLVPVLQDVLEHNASGRELSTRLAALL